MTNTQTRTALITGASEGLGLALARALTQGAWQVIIDARTEDNLQRAAAELGPRAIGVAPETLARIYDVNVFAPLALTQLLLPDLVAAGAVSGWPRSRAPPRLDG